MSLSAPVEAEAWPPLPTETEIYILPDGRVVIADLPSELAPLLAELGVTEPYAVVAVDEQPTANQAGEAEAA